jgi:uncharacterized membrane protein (DUF2068 family)
VLRKIVDWARWEFGRPIEVTLGIRLITIERFVKGALLIIGGIVLIVAGSRTDLHSVTVQIQNELNLSAGRSWWRSLVLALIKRFGNLSKIQVDAVGVGAILYGCLEAFEGFGLLLRRRWAEYLVLIATAAFLPLEITELLRKPTVLKSGALIINLLIVGYLIWRKKLFLERPDHAEADRTEGPPQDIVS